MIIFWGLRINALDLLQTHPYVMGQSASSEDGNAHSKANIEMLSKEALQDYFRKRCLSTIRSLEMKVIATKLNVTSLNDVKIITPSDLSYLLQLSNDKSMDTQEISLQFHYINRILYNSCRVVGSLPFILDYSNDVDVGLSVEHLLIATSFHSARYNKFLSDYDYLKLVFLSLYIQGTGPVESPSEESIPSKDSEEYVSKEKSDVQENIAVVEKYEVQVEVPIEETDSGSAIAKKIKWSTLEVIQKYDDLDIDTLKISAYDLQQLIVLFLVVISVPKKNHNEMQAQLEKNLKKWTEFEVYGLSLMRYISVDITSENIRETEIGFHEFLRLDSCIPDFIQNSFKVLFKYGLLSPLVADPNIPVAPQSEPVEDETPKPAKKKYSFPKFKETKLINDASISLISLITKALGSETTITNQNLVKLYAGSEAGFSIRSLELKIFKWQAPTIFIVSGKRLKNKTITTNKRYEQFNSEYPRFFRSLESNKRDWQTDNDKITYAVFVNQPWRNSNKRNFGDENSIIMCLLPKLDFYKSTHNPVLKGELVYFNNLGMGLGFGNSQPLNKNNVKKYLPGDVSLTIEANLEFAVFRHLVGQRSNSATYFRSSNQEQIKSQDFEDRFMITDVEVWGVGSTVELEEQRKQWEWEEKQAQARQGVNLKNLGEERAFLEMVGLVGNNSSGGSV